MAKTAVGAPLVYTAGPGETRWLNDFPVSSNPNYLTYMNDFMSAHDFNTTTEFNALLSGTGTTAIQTDGINGTVLVTSQATTDNAGSYFGLVQENFRVGDGANGTIANRKLWYSTRLQMSTPGDQDMFAGFSIAVATAAANVWTDATTTGKICFEILDGSPLVLARTVAAGVATTTTTPFTMLANTYAKFDIVVSATSLTNRVAEFYINNNFVARHTTNIPASSVPLTPGVGFLSGSASGTMTGLVDYLATIAER